MSVFDLHYLLDLKEFGRKRANPYACITNNLKLEATTSKDCCVGIPSCKDTVDKALAPDAMIAKVVFDGITYDLTQDIKSLGNELILAAPGHVAAGDTKMLDKVLRAIYLTKEFDAYCGVKEVDGEVHVCHIGACVLEKLILADDTECTTSRCCTIGTKNTYKQNLRDAVGPVVYGDSTTEVEGGPFEYDTEDAAANATTAEELATAMEEALAEVPGLTGVEVGVNDVLGCFELTFCAMGEDTIKIGDTYPVLCESKVDFSCPDK